MSHSNLAQLPTRLQDREQHSRVYCGAPPEGPKILVTLVQRVGHFFKDMLQCLDWQLKQRELGIEALSQSRSSIG